MTGTKIKPQVGNRLLRCKKAAGGNYPAAHLLYRICFWHPFMKVNRNGHLWIAKEGWEWRLETDLSPQQYKDAVYRLKEKLLIVVEVHFHGGKLKSHVRLTERGTALLFDESWGLQTPSGKGGLTPSQDQMGDTLMGDTGEISKEDISLAKSETGIGQEVPGEMEEQMATVQDMLNGKMKKKTKAKPVSAFEKLRIMWIGQMVKIKGGFQPPLTHKQIGQLKQIEKAYPPEVAWQVVHTVTENWGAFVSQVQAQKGLAQVPLEPVIGFVLSHCKEAVDFACGKETGEQKPVAPAKKPAMVPAVQVLAEPAAKKLTPEELAAILEEDDD